MLPDLPGNVHRVLRSDARPFEQTYPAVPETVTTARRAVEHYLAETKLEHIPLDDIRLAVAEAVGNAVTHAFVEREPGDVTVQVVQDGGQLRLTVEDNGRGLQPRDDSPGLGLGLGLIKKVTQRFETRSELGAGTKLLMWFPEGARAGALAVG